MMNLFVLPSLKLTYPLKIDPGKGDSYWKPSFLGAMLVSGSVHYVLQTKKDQKGAHIASDFRIAEVGSSKIQTQTPPAERSHHIYLGLSPLPVIVANEGL